MKINFGLSYLECLNVYLPKIFLIIHVCVSGR